jgi:UDP-N-acetylmuramate dehydrogenase
MSRPPPAPSPTEHAVRLETVLPEIQAAFPHLHVIRNAPLCDFTTFRLGGPCPLFIDRPSAEDLPDLIRLLNRHNLRFLVIGQGANLVFSDRGIDRAVIRFCTETPDLRVDGRRVTVSGDTLLDDLAAFTVEHGIGDLTFCTGIPGTVGGGLAGNAGAFGRQMGDPLVSALLLDRFGKTRTVTPRELEFAYRHSKLKETGEIVLQASFELPEASREVLQTERERILTFRREHHPDWHETPCAGSVFRNIEPTSAVERRKAAGFFLQEAGAQKFRIGGARLYEKHANIIVADPGCTAQEVWALSEKMARAVKEKFGIELIREVRFLGEFGTGGPVDRTKRE